jgi:hypothetical protein
MKQACSLLVLAFMLLSGCKPKSQSKNAFDMPDVTTLKNKNNNNIESSGHWTQSYRDDMSNSLRGYARKNGIPATQIDDFTNCVINSLEIKFPGENVDKESAEAQSILQNCQKNFSNDQSNSNTNSYNNNNSQVWSTADQQEFLDNCTPGASKSLGSRAGSDYCNCVMKKLMQEYPDSKDVSKASQQHISELAADCKKSVYE